MPGRITDMVKRLLLVTIVVGLWQLATSSVAAQTQMPWWEFQSIDTMKYSRDVSRQALSDPSFDVAIAEQVQNIADVGVTHIGIATPYDEEFIPVLKRWVSAARNRGLKVWFRGNFSGWEGWFGYPSITRAEHLAKTKEFIHRHPELFEDGDLFSACPECENGGPGDPRLNGDAAGHRQFLIDEYRVTREAFHQIGKNVPSNLHSMNGDVARLIMDEATTKELGGLITIDHYVRSTEQLVRDAQYYAEAGQGQVIFGEFGAPIPDIHGNLSPEDQAAWIDEALTKLAQEPSVVGINYWVGLGGSTRLWNDDGTPRPAVEVLRKHFQPQVISGRVIGETGRPLSGVTVASRFKNVQTTKDGEFAIPVLTQDQSLTFSAPKYISQTVDLSQTQDFEISLQMENPTLWIKIFTFLRNLW